MICWSSNWPQVFFTECSTCCQIRCYHLLILSCGSNLCDPWFFKDSISRHVCGNLFQLSFTFLFDRLFCNFHFLTIQIQRCAHNWLRVHLGISMGLVILIGGINDILTLWLCHHFWFLSLFVENFSCIQI